MLTIKNLARMTKSQTSIIKVQRNFKFQTPSKNRASGTAWSLKFQGISLADIAKALAVSCALLLASGCTPPGPSALLEGKRLIERGKYPEAIERLKVATSLLVTNAQGWNYLGLACQYASQNGDAEKAYERAIKLDNDLSEARYNLGCLFLSQGKLDAARQELTAFTLRRCNYAAGLLQFGEVQVRQNDLNAAERCFNDVLRLDSQQPEAFNGLGLIPLNRGRAPAAAQIFTAALRLRPDYRPARLNLAVVSHE